jgi:hypothetical protein
MSDSFRKAEQKVLGFLLEQRVHAITINRIEEQTMSYPIKAEAGDYIFIDGSAQRVVFVSGRDEQPEYELEDGRRIGNRDFSYDDVLLESEVY